jgi:hypothetical protein
VTVERTSAQQNFDTVFRTVTFLKRQIDDENLLEDLSPIVKLLIPLVAQLTLAKTLVNKKLNGEAINLCPTTGSKLLDPPKEEMDSTYRLASTLQAQQLIMSNRRSAVIAVFPEMRDEVERLQQLHEVDAVPADDGGLTLGERGQHAPFRRAAADRHPIAAPHGAARAAAASSSSVGEVTDKVRFVLC